MVTFFRACLRSELDVEDNIFQLHGMSPARDEQPVLNATQHQASGQTMIRALNYSLPDNVADHIEVVYPTTSSVTLIDQMLRKVD